MIKSEGYAKKGENTTCAHAAVNCGESWPARVHQPVKTLRITKSARFPRLHGRQEAHRLAEDIAIAACIRGRSVR